MLRKLISNTLAQLVAKVIGAGLTLLTTYYTISLAGLPLYGDLSKIIVLVSIGYTLVDFGLNAEAIRRKTPVATVIVTRLFLSLFMLLALNIFIFLLGGGYSPEIKRVFWLGSLAIVFQGFYTSANAYFQANLAYWRSTLSVVIGSLFGAALTLYFLFSSPTLPHLILANTLGYLVIAACALLLIPRTQFENWRIFDLRLILPLLRRALPLGLILIASVMASKVDTVLLGIFRSSSEVGAYSFAYRIFDVILVFPVYVMNAIYPIMFSPTRSSQLLRKTIIALSLLGVAAGSILWFSAPLVLYVKPELSLSIPVIRLLSLSTPLFYLTAPLMWQLISRQKDLLVLRVYLFAMVVNFVLNLLLVPSLGIIASAAITGATELLILIALLYFSHNKFESLII